MSLERRFALLAAAEAAGAWIVEDDYDGEFCYRRPPAADAQEASTHRARHLRRHVLETLFPALRLGYMLAPPPLVDRVRAVSRPPIRRVCRLACRRSWPSSSRKAISPLMSGGCEGSMRTT